MRCSKKQRGCVRVRIEFKFVWLQNPCPFYKESFWLERRPLRGSNQADFPIILQAAGASGPSVCLEEGGEAQSNLGGDTNFCSSNCQFEFPSPWLGSKWWSWWSANKNDERIFSAPGVAAASRIRPSLDIHGGLVPWFPRMPKSKDAQVPYIKWCSICL